MKKHPINWLFAGVIAALGITILCIPYNRKPDTTAKPSNDTIPNTPVTVFEPNRMVDTLSTQIEDVIDTPWIEQPFDAAFDPLLYPEQLDSFPDIYDGKTIDFPSENLSSGYITNGYLSLQSNYTDTNEDYSYTYYLTIPVPLIEPKGVPPVLMSAKTGIFYADDDFHNNLLRICINQKWGYLNTLGRIEIPCIYDHASPFENGTATVRKNVTWHQIDTTGRILYTYRDSLPYHLESIVTESQKLHPVKNIRKRLTKVFELYESWRIQYMTNPTFRKLYCKGRNYPKRYPIPYLDELGSSNIVTCTYNNDSIPDYFITICPDDLAYGCGIGTIFPRIHLLIVSDGEDYRFQNDPLLRQYKALQYWLKLELEYDVLPSPLLEIDTMYKLANSNIFQGTCLVPYENLKTKFTTRIIHPDTSQEGDTAPWTAQNILVNTTISLRVLIP